MKRANEVNVVDSKLVKSKRIELLKSIRDRNKHIKITNSATAANVKSWLSGRSCPSWDQFVDYCKHYELDLGSSLLLAGYRSEDLSYDYFVTFLLLNFNRDTLKEVLGLSPSSISKISSLQVRLNLDKILLLMGISSRPFSLSLSRLLGKNFALRNDSEKQKEKYRYIEKLMMEKPWVNTLIEASYLFSDENMLEKSTYFGSSFGITAEEVKRTFNGLIEQGILEKDESGNYKPTISGRSMDYFPEYVLEYMRYFADKQIQALGNHRDNYAITNTLAVSRKTALQISQKYWEFENHAKMLASCDQKKEVVLQMDHYFWILYRDFEKEKIEVERLLRSEVENSRAQH